MSHNADIIGLITDRLERHLKIRVQWVKAHQDHTTPYPDLDMLARMNTDVDTLAERFWLLMVDGIVLPLQQGLQSSVTAVTYPYPFPLLTLNPLHHPKAEAPSVSTRRAWMDQ
jgi:hypothetical protein